MNPKKPLVTIITATFDLVKAKRDQYFRLCIESVHNQSYENIEHLIIDGGSGDGTLDIIKEYADRGWIRYVSEPDKGIYDAMNKGVRMAKGKYFAILNSDDFYHNPDSVMSSVEALENNGADFSYANFLTIGDGKTTLVKGDINSFLYTMPFGHPTMFAKTEVVCLENAFDEQFKLPADYDLIIRMILKGYHGIYIDKQIATYRLGGAGSSTEHSDDIAKIYIKNYSKFFPYLDLKKAKDIMYKQEFPKGFAERFKEYAIKSKLDNINIESICECILEHEKRNILNKAVFIFTKKYPIFYYVNYFLRKINFSKKTLYPFKFKKYLSKPVLFKAAIKKEAEKIPVFLSSDNNYSPLVASTIFSILENTDSFIEFYVLDGGISEKNKNKIRKSLKAFQNYTLEFVRIDTQKIFKNFPVRVHFTLDMYTRYLIPQIKPKLNKVIYSDVDVIFADDITRLFNEDLNGHILGAVPYTYGYLNKDNREIDEFHKRLALSNDHKYFESGLLLMDCEKWRRNDITKKLLDKARQRKDKILTPDQDVLNMVFENNYQHLSNKYIVVPHRKEIMLSNEQTRKSIEQPFIYHFAGPNKPWKSDNVEYEQYFWEIASKTEFYDELILRFLRQMHKKILQKTLRKITFNLSLFSKLFFVITSPKKFTKKYYNKIVHGKLRQPARRFWYALRLKKIK